MPKRKRKKILDTPAQHILNRIKAEENANYPKLKSANTIKEFRFALKDLLELRSGGEYGSFYGEFRTADNKQNLNLRVSGHDANPANYHKEDYVRLSIFFDDGVNDDGERKTLNDIPRNKKSTVNEMVVVEEDFTYNKEEIMKSILEIIKKAVKDGEVDLYRDAPVGHVTKYQVTLATTLGEQDGTSDEVADCRFHPCEIQRLADVFSRHLRQMEGRNRLYDNRHPANYILRQKPHRTFSSRLSRVRDNGLSRRGGSVVCRPRNRR